MSKTGLDMEGKPSIVLLPAVQHTGSRFVRWDILNGYKHRLLDDEPLGHTCYYCHLGPDRKPERFLKWLGKEPAIVPLRHPRRVFKSWQKRSQKTSDCIKEWEFLITQVLEYDVYFMPVDSFSREFYLKKIQDELNLGHDLDWRPRGNKAGTMFMEPDHIGLDDQAEKFIESIDWFIDKFWRATVTEQVEVARALFKNITNNKIDAYGYQWRPEQEVWVNNKTLIDKFRLYHQLEEVNIIEADVIEVAQEPQKQEVSEIEKMKQTAIEAGMKVDKRWGEKRLIKEVQDYLSKESSHCYQSRASN